MSDVHILLSESPENVPPDGFTLVETEIEFLRRDIGGAKLFVRGVKLCDYIRVLCQARKIHFKEIVSPRSRLQSLLGSISDKISASLLSRCLEILDHESPKNLAELLFHLTRDEFWLAPLSTEHAAAFLMAEFEEDIHDLVERQRQIWISKNLNRQYDEIYTQSFEHRELFLLKWFFDEKTRRDLGEFPLLVTNRFAIILLEAIEQNLRKTAGLAALHFPRITPNKKIYAKAIEDYFVHHPDRLTADLIAQISPLLTSSERTKLEKLLPQSEVSPLMVDSDFQTALDWATNIYFPFRAMNTTNNETADVLAESFASWLLENYPKMAVGDYENSLINLRTFHTVQRLQEQGFWVLWTVVDGLTYLNHKKLLKFLGEGAANLRIEEDSKVFAVLPTITSRAKYGLTSGKFPSENSKNEWDFKNVFAANFLNGIYAGNNDEEKLLEGLQCEQPTVCYWNYTELDNCFHQQKSLTFIENKVDSILRGLAGNINHLVLLAKEIDRVAVVICSDHGQMMSNCRKLEVDLGDCDTHGRTALETSSTIFNYANLPYVKTNNGETVYLNPISFRLNEPTTIALGSTYFVDLKATNHYGAVGVHGGLYPEETVLGLAVLMRQTAHKKLSAEVNGNGETGKLGKIVITIDNPNSIAVNPLSITIENLTINQQGKLLLTKIAPKDVKEFEISVEKFPPPTTGEEFEVKGFLIYEFDDGTQEECTVTGKIICKSLYTTRNPSLLNRFKK